MRQFLAFASIFAAVGLAQQATPSISNVTNAGSGDAHFCSGLLITIVGNNFGNDAGAVSVIAGGQTAGVIDVNNSVIHAQLPFTLSSVATTVSVNVAGQGSNPFSITVDNYAPAFYGSPSVTPNPAAIGQTVTAQLVGLGATTPFVAVGTVPITSAPTVTTPTITLGGNPILAASSALGTTAAGVYQVTFVIPTTAVVGTPQDLVISIGGKSTPKTSITIAPPLGGPAILTLVNAGSSSAGFSAGALVSITGFNFNSATVSIGQKLAYIAQASSTNLLVELPVDLLTGPATLTISTPGQKPAAFQMNIDPVAPAFYGTFHDPTGTAYSATNPAAPGKKVIGMLVGLGVTSPGVPTGQSTGVQAPTVALPTLTIGGKAAPFTYCGLMPGVVGVYELDFAVPVDAPAGTPNVVLTIAGVATPAQTLTTSALAPTLIGFKNAASGQTKDATHGIAPNTFLSIYATNLGSADSTQNLFPGTTYQGTQVLFNGTPAPLYNVIPSANLINLVVPSELPEAGTATVNIVNQNGPGQNLTLNLASTDVGVFRIPDSTNPTRQIAAATIANKAWTILPSATAAAYKFAACPAASAVTACAGPAHPGDAIVIYFTGGGKATPNGDPNGQPVATGSVAPADGSVVYKTVATPALKIGGLDAPILFSGIAPGTAAEYQINTTVPLGVTPSDDVAVVLTIGNSSDTVTIAVQNP